MSKVVPAKLSKTCCVKQPSKILDAKTLHLHCPWQAELHTNMLVSHYSKPLPSLSILSSGKVQIDGVQIILSK